MLPVVALSLVLSWVQVQSDTFVVKSSVGLERAKRVLSELEAFKELIGTTLVFRKVELPELPIEVLLIGNDAQFNELSPEYKGKKVKVAGYYERGQDRDFIVLSPRSTGNLTHVVYHELTHYFLSRSLEWRPTWLNEGLAEYFATADIDEEAAYLGGLSQSRLDLLKFGRMLPLKEFLAVDDRSPYYNENAKANVFYAQAWAFVHFLTHGPYRDQFRRYLETLAHHDAPLSDYVTLGIAELEHEFEAYLKLRIRTVMRDKVKVHPDAWQMTAQPIGEQDVELAIAEIFLSSGKLDDARRHVERAAGMVDEFPRASYYRGVLARLTHEADPREFFIDALLDLNLGPRAAVHLVQLHELQIPAARRALEQAAAKPTHMADVYWALSEIYMDDARRAEEILKLARTPYRPIPSYAPRVEEPAVEPLFNGYADGVGDHFRYQLLSEAGNGPRIESIVPPFLPVELLNDKQPGQVVVDVQLSDKGDVAAMWLISAAPDVYGSLATGAIREWKFEPVAAKIRVVVHFIP